MTVRSTKFRIEIGADRVIRGDTFLSQSSDHNPGVLVICHGFKGFKDWGMFPYLGQQFSDLFHVVTFNFSHNGVGEDGVSFSELEKFARNTYSSELEDLESVISAIRAGQIEIPLNNAHTSKDGPKPPIFLLGHSRGGAVAILNALDHPNEINGVLSWNGVVAVDIFNDETKREMREQGRAFIDNARTKQKMPLNLEILTDLEKHQERYNIVARAGTLQVPVALIQGTDDNVRLQHGSKRLIESNPNIAWIRIEDGNHTFGSVHPFAGETGPLTEAIRQSKQLLIHWLEAQGK